MFRKSLLFLLFSSTLLVGNTAFAIPPGQVIPKIGAQCPNHYRVDGQYCTPMPQATFAIARIGNQCPEHYRIDRQVYCVANHARAVTDILPLQGPRCPQNYRLQRGVYCVR